MKTDCHLLPAAIWLLLLGGLVGCQTFREASGLLEQKSSSAGMTSSELRVVLDDLVLQYCSRVELAADQIAARTDDPIVQKHALLWKTNGISACFQAASRSDPLGAYFDIWILNKQSLELFHRSAPNSFSVPNSLFGEAQPIAIHASQQLEQSLQEILQRIGQDFPIREDFAIQFAHDYPIQDLYFNRASIAANYTDYIEKITVEGRDLKQVVSGLDRQIDQLHKLTAMYAEFLPKQARWQAELLMLETMQDDDVQVAIADMTEAADGVVTVAKFADALPDLIAQERDILRATITEERKATLANLEAMQIDTVEKLQRERVAVMDEVKRERDVILRTLQEERVAATRDFTGFGQQIVDQIDESADTKIDNIARHGLLLTEHIFKKLTQLFIVLLTFLAVAWWLNLSRSDSRRGAPPTEGQDVSFPLEGQGDSPSNASSNRRHAA